MLETNKSVNSSDTNVNYLAAKIIIAKKSRLRFRQDWCHATIGGAGDDAGWRRIAF